MPGAPKKLNLNQNQITLTKLTGVPDAYKSPEGTGILLCFQIEIVADQMVIVQYVQLIMKMKIFADRMTKLDITEKFTMGIRMLIPDCKGKRRSLFPLVVHYFKFHNEV